MKPAPFRYVAPESTSAATAVLAEHGDEATVLAGGQSLIPLLNMRLARPSVVVDVTRIADLSGWSMEPGALRIGAVTRARKLELSADLAARHPLLHRALRLVAHPQIRSRTTVGGNIAHADPAAELPAVLLALDGAVTVESTAGRRRIPAAEFFEGPMMTSRRADELVVAVDFPFCSELRWGFDEVARRQGDFAIVAACIGLAIVDGAVAAARVVLAGCGSTPLPCPAIEAALIGATAGSDLADVDEAVTAAIDPTDDLHGSAAYRRRVAAALVRRLTRSLLERAA